MLNVKVGLVYNFLWICKIFIFYFLIYKIYKIERIVIIEYILVYKVGLNLVVFFFCI